MEISTIIKASCPLEKGSSSLNDREMSVSSEHTIGFLSTPSMCGRPVEGKAPLAVLDGAYFFAKQDFI